MITRYRTRNSTYEVDLRAKRIRRTVGVNPPTGYQAADGEWQPYQSLRRSDWPGGGLLITWDGDRVTWTSAVLEVETDAQPE